MMKVGRRGVLAWAGALVLGLLMVAIGGLMRPKHAQVDAQRFVKTASARIQSDAALPARPSAEDSNASAMPSPKQYLIKRAIRLAQSDAATRRRAEELSRDGGDAANRFFRRGQTRSGDDDASSNLTGTVLDPAIDWLSRAAGAYRKEVVPRLKHGGGFDAKTEPRQRDIAIGPRGRREPGKPLDIRFNDMLSELRTWMGRAVKDYQGQIVPRLLGRVPETQVARRVPRTQTEPRAPVIVRPENGGAQSEPAQPSGATRTEPFVPRSGRAVANRRPQGEDGEQTPAAPRGTLPSASSPAGSVEIGANNREPIVPPVVSPRSGQTPASPRGTVAPPAANDGDENAVTSAERRAWQNLLAQARRAATNAETVSDTAQRRLSDLTQRRQSAREAVTAQSRALSALRRARGEVTTEAGRRLIANGITQFATRYTELLNVDRSARSLASSWSREARTIQGFAERARRSATLAESTVGLLEQTEKKSERQSLEVVLRRHVDNAQRAQLSAEQRIEGAPGLINIPGVLDGQLIIARALESAAPQQRAVVATPLPSQRPQRGIALGVTERTEPVAPPRRFAERNLPVRNLRIGAGRDTTVPETGTLPSERSPSGDPGTSTPSTRVAVKQPAPSGRKRAQRKQVARWRRRLRRSRARRRAYLRRQRRRRRARWRRVVYIVRRGDNLWNISRRYYGLGRRYRRIARANRRKIRNVNLIYPRQRLRIPMRRRR